MEEGDKAGKKTKEIKEEKDRWGGDIKISQGQTLIIFWTILIIFWTIKLNNLWNWAMEEKSTPKNNKSCFHRCWPPSPNPSKYPLYFYF